MAREPGPSEDEGFPLPTDDTPTPPPMGPAHFLELPAGARAFLIGSVVALVLLLFGGIGLCVGAFGSLLP